MTFSITGHCPDSGMFGVAITTSSICVGSRCPWVRAGVGAVATQNVTLPSIGRMVLDEMEQGRSAEAAVQAVMAGLDHADYRQVTVVDRQGNTALFSGAKTLGTNGDSQGRHCVAAGNLLRSAALPQAMTEKFESLAGTHLADRLLRSLEAGLYEAGGEEGTVHSAALLVASDQEWPLVDLRVDWHEEDPVRALRVLWTDYEPQMNDYITRALNPSAAPSYGVPGDE
ncbi:MAG: DUF1028 domain-containing protein [Pseudomonadota bacterium]